MYGGFPFTVFSQLTTGPMLDVLAPENAVGLSLEVCFCIKYTRLTNTLPFWWQ